MILWSSLFLLINMHLMVLMACGCFDDTKGAVLVKNLAAKEPSAHGLDAYYKQYYPCLSAAAATIKWTEAEKGVIVTNHPLLLSLSLSGDLSFSCEMHVSLFVKNFYISPTRSFLRNRCIYLMI
ncbi:hypothetical protein BDE02_03G068700 [Populus trichocarpa]|nr:hypothetical protein BDE02_03G068700 [Populus trichocarpa]